MLSEKDIDPWKDKIDESKVLKYLAIHGKKGTLTMANLEKAAIFVEVMTTDVGQFMLREVVVGMEKILRKIIDLKASDNEIAEYRVYRKLFNAWSKVILRAEEAKQKINSVE